MLVKTTLQYCTIMDANELESYAVENRDLGVDLHLLVDYTMLKFDHETIKKSNKMVGMITYYNIIQD